MSLCRFAEKMPGGKESDVYMFEHCRGGIECCGCALHAGGSVQMFSAIAAIEHVHLHRLAGHNVPARCLGRLRPMAAAERKANRESYRKLREELRASGGKR